MNKMSELRTARGITQSQLAAAIGVSERHIAFIEKGERSPSIKIALKIASCLETSVEEIFLLSNCTYSTDVAQ